MIEDLIDCEPVYDPRQLARQFVADALQHAEAERQRELAEIELDRREQERMARSAADKEAAKRRWNAMH